MYNLTNKTKRALYKKKNVRGLGYGDMYKDGKFRGKGIVVTVGKKVASTVLKKSDLIPKQLEGQDVDVVQVGNLKALPKKKEDTSSQAVDRKKKHRPFPMGVSIGHKDITAGTAGCLVYKNDKVYVLSNNHVLANCNDCEIGDAILQPGKYDGGTLDDKAGVLSDFVPIKYVGGGGGDIPCPISEVITRTLNLICRAIGSGVNFNYVKQDLMPENLVDAALCEIMPQNIAVEELADLGVIKTVGVANIGDLLKKSGRTTSTTTGGLVRIVDYEGLVDYGEHGQVFFGNQILVEKDGFSAGGDSGSAVVREDASGNTLVGLLFAGSDTHTVINHISNVIEALGINVGVNS
jgi:hypothetical protein